MWEKGMVRWLPEAAQAKGHELTVDVVSLPGRHWKWRMHAAALTLVGRMVSSGMLDRAVDAFLVTDMMDVGQFRAALPAPFRGVPIVVYFHENQLTFPEHPERPTKEWDRHYAFLNVTSAWLADQVWFNSEYHRSAFLGALPDFLGGLPAPRPNDAPMVIGKKSVVVPLGLELDLFEESDAPEFDFGPGPPVIAWNHRWEYDKGPAAFLDILRALKEEGCAFRLAIFGQAFQSSPPAFERMKEEMQGQIVHWGHVESRTEYVKRLRACDIALVTAHHDFFGLSVLESAAVGLDVIAPRELAYAEHFPNEDLCLREELKSRVQLALLNDVEGRWTRNAAEYQWPEVARRAWKQLQTAWARL